MSFKEFQLKGFIYRSSKPLIFFAFIVILAYALICFNYSGWSGKTYYFTECPNETRTGQCLNAYYQSNLCNEGKIAFDNPLCTQKYLSEGSHLGEEAPWFIQKFRTLSILFFALILLFNTLIFNKGFFKYMIDKVKNVGDP